LGKLEESGAVGANVENPSGGAVQEPREKHRMAPTQHASSDGLPVWVTITVVLGVLALLAYNVIVVGPEGYPVSVMLGGVLSLYGGANELVKRARRNGGDS
jgi:hypothetical protein